MGQQFIPALGKKCWPGLHQQRHGSALRHGQPLQRPRRRRHAPTPGGQNQAADTSAFADSADHRPQRPSQPHQQRHRRQQPCLARRCCGCRARRPSWAKQPRRTERDQKQRAGRPQPTGAGRHARISCAPNCTPPKARPGCKWATCCTRPTTTGVASEALASSCAPTHGAAPEQPVVSCSAPLLNNGLGQTAEPAEDNAPAWPWQNRRNNWPPPSIRPQVPTNRGPGQRAGEHAKLPQTWGHTIEQDQLPHMEDANIAIVGKAGVGVTAGQDLDPVRQRHHPDRQRARQPDRIRRPSACSYRSGHWHFGGRHSGRNGCRQRI